MFGIFLKKSLFNVKKCFTSEGNTYRHCTASSLPLWGNTDVASSDIKRNFRRHCEGGSSTYTRFLVTILISSQFTLFSICLSVFLSPTSQKSAVLFALFFVRHFLIRSIFLFAILLPLCLCCHVSSICLHIRLLKIY